MMCVCQHWDILGPSLVLQWTWTLISLSLSAMIPTPTAKWKWGMQIREESRGRGSSTELELELELGTLTLAAFDFILLTLTSTLANPAHLAAYPHCLLSQFQCPCCELEFKRANSKCECKVQSWSCSLNSNGDERREVPEKTNPNP